MSGRGRGRGGWGGERKGSHCMLFECASLTSCSARMSQSSTSLAMCFSLSRMRTDWRKCRPLNQQKKTTQLLHPPCIFISIYKAKLMFIQQEKNSYVVYFSTVTVYFSSLCPQPPSPPVPLTATIIWVASYPGDITLPSLRHHLLCLSARGVQFCGRRLQHSCSTTPLTTRSG